MPSEPDSELAARLLPELQKLIFAEDMNSPEAALAIAELKRIGGVIGLYVAAAKMRIFLDAKRAVGQVIHKDRGYVLAADFIFQHVNRGEVWRVAIAELADACVVVTQRD